MFYPLDVILSPTASAAVTEWRKPKWRDAGAPFPGIVKALRAWREGAVLRKLKAEDDASH